MTDPDRAAFLRAIALSPWDDTPRLVFADWLEEQPREVPCGKCRGRGTLVKRGIGGQSNSALNPVCPACNGTGTVPDTHDADLAAFIRAQCEIAVWQPRILACDRRDDIGCGWSLPLPERDEYDALRRHERELFTRHGDRWRECPCPGCGGKGWTHTDSHSNGKRGCLTCGGAGDLLKTRWQWQAPDNPETRSEGIRSRNPTFARGFVDAVECRLEELGREVEYASLFPPGRVFVPSAWARAVVTTLPVTRFVLTDRVPTQVASMWEWRNQRVFHSGADVLPEWLYLELESDTRWRFMGQTFTSYPTEADAADALALAAGRTARRAVYGA